ncbi:hypothetical protein LIQ93_19395, partial [[Ruminococcus] gnavus]|uniref:hypothetical protein n=1 Tax=Mediterraneibacter gnavus TaxID=33038 RepID=UPI001D0401CB
EKRMASLYKRNFSLGNRGILIQNLTESNKSPVEIVKGNKQWVGTCLYQEECKLLLINCGAVIWL